MQQFVCYNYYIGIVQVLHLNSFVTLPHLQSVQSSGFVSDRNEIGHLVKCFNNLYTKNKLNLIYFQDA